MNYLYKNGSFCLTSATQTRQYKSKQLFDELSARGILFRTIQEESPPRHKNRVLGFYRITPPDGEVFYVLSAKEFIQATLTPNYRHAYTLMKYHHYKGYRLELLFKIKTTESLDCQYSSQAG